MIQAIGSGVRHLQPGDRVGALGDHNGGCGTYATHAVLDVDVHWPAPLPSNITVRQAASCINQGVTGHALTHDVYPVQPGDTCLVHAAAGGSGMLPGQMARMRGAWVIGTVSTDAKRQVALEYGAADEVILYDGFDTKVRALTGGEGVRAVYDHVGKTTFERGINCLARRGCFVYYEVSAGRVPPFDLNKLGRIGSQYVTRPTVFDYIETREKFLERLMVVFGWVGGGALKLKMDHIYPLEQAAEAQIALGGRQTTGKVLLLP